MMEFEGWEVMGLFCALTITVITQFYTHIKTHRTITLKRMTFTIHKF